MASTSTPDADSPLLPEESPLIRRRAFWFGLVTIWLFAAAFLQFGLIDYLALPASERVNNGDKATFFAVHINPYFTFSEDFHLYVVRSKRIMDRGWTDSPLASTPNEQASYASPLQAMLMMVAVATDGRPIPYSIFIFGVLATSWTVLYVAASLWLPRGVSPLAIPAIVLITLLCEALRAILHTETDFAQWPVHRGLRMATLAWSNPLATALVLAAISLLFRREKPWARIAFAGVVLCILATADTWSFLVCAACTGLVLATMGAMLVFGRQRLAGSVRPLLVAGFALGFTLLLAFGIHQATSPGWSVDVLGRAGFGPEWKESSSSIAETKTFYRIIRTKIVVLAGLLILASIYGSTRFSIAGRTLTSNLKFAWPSPLRTHLLCLVLIPTIAVCTAVKIMGVIGMDEYHGFQFLWRTEFMFLFWLTIVIAEGVKLASRGIVNISWSRTRLEVAIAAGFLVALFAYHNYRIHYFVSHTAAREFFLTKDEEALRDWLRSREPAGRYTLATASHELNYLCAYWTNADLLLPEGFPYHGTLSNDEIQQRMTQVLAIYGATPTSWQNFVLHRHVWDQWSWGISRTLSARHGYMYYLMHRLLLVKGNLANFPRPSFPFHTTPYLAEFKTNHEERVADGRFLMHEEGVYVAQMIGQRLAELPPLQPADMPDVIIVDDVARALGSAKLTGYRREFHHGEIEAWVRTNSRVARRTGG